MTEFRYILDKSSKKYVCPECGKKRFVRYFDTKTAQLLPGKYGRCDRESNCGYSLSPYSDSYVRNEYKQSTNNVISHKVKSKVNLKHYIPIQVLKQTLSEYGQNVFIQNLLNRVKFTFDLSDIEKVISLYYLGTIKKGDRKGAITFPFIDIQNRIRAIQVKQFDETNHTAKDGTTYLHSIIEKDYYQQNNPLPTWLQSYKKNEKIVSCLFGEHLLNRYKYNPIALVEAPKTAVYCTLYFGYPEHKENFLWVAVGALSYLNLERCQALKRRNICLFPDLSENGNAFKVWSSKANMFEKELQDSKFDVSDLLEKLAPQSDKKQGKDIADYLIKLDWRQFRKDS